MVEKRNIWFWQGMITPHMAGLAVALARRDCDVTYATQQTLSEDRAQQGWSLPSLDGVYLRIATSRHETEALVATAPPDAIHVCGGLRSNGLIRAAQATIARLGRRQWIVMETVDDAGWRGGLRRLEYGRLFRRWRGRLQGILAIGHATPAWLIARGLSPNVVFPFSYFLARNDTGLRQPRGHSGPFRFLFVGQLIERKRLDLLIECLGKLALPDSRLAVIGSGPLEQSLRVVAANALPERLDWVGPLAMEDVAREMAHADCLVLPSRHDGWGAVVSEALMVGTPVICSDACGAAGVVRASGRGGVFRSGDQTALTALLERAVAAGPPSNEDRRSLANWAWCLGAEAGADYLLAILDHAETRRERPTPPWEGRSTGGC